MSKFMRFTILYPNQPEVRTIVHGSILQALKQGMDLSKQSANGPNFQTRPSWPNISELMTIPLSIQVEEVELVDDSLKSLRVNIIDAEIIEIVKEPSNVNLQENKTS
jgi:hypothetical protein